MDLGYSITSFFTADVAPEDAADAVVERARIAAEAGFDVVEAGDHHAVSGGGYLQNVPTVARITEHFDRVAGMFLLPLYDPLLLAEQVGTIDAFAEDLDFWCAVGPAGQTAALGVPPGERAARFEESLDLLRRLWSEDDVTFDGEFYAVDGVSVNPKAEPRVCIGGTAERPVRRAGRLGDAWIANADLGREAIAERLDWFDEAGGGDVIVRRDVLALADGDTAHELAAEKLEAGYRGWSADADWVWAGDAGDVASRMDELADLGVDEVVVRPMSDTHAEETLREVARARNS